MPLTEKKKFLIRETRSTSLPRNLPASEKLMDSLISDYQLEQFSTSGLQA